MSKNLENPENFDFSHQNYFSGNFDEISSGPKFSIYSKNRTSSEKEEIFALKLEIGRLNDENEKLKNELANSKNDLKNTKISLKSSVSKEKMQIDALKNEIFTRDKKISNFERKLKTAEHNLSSKTKSFEELQYKFLLALNSESPGKFLGDFRGERIAELERQIDTIHRDIDNNDASVYEEVLEVYRARLNEYVVDFEKCQKDKNDLEKKLKNAIEIIAKYEEFVNKESNKV